MKLLFVTVLSSHSQNCLYCASFVASDGEDWAAIDAKFRAGDRGRARRREEGDKIRYFPGLAGRQIGVPPSESKGRASRRF